MIEYLKAQNKYSAHSQAVQPAAASRRLPPPQQNLPTMPKKSTKSKSKRTTLKQKYKLIKKVKEHHKKKRREESRKKRLGVKAKERKDPGIPAQWPYKEELLKEIDHEVEKKIVLEEAKADEKRIRRMENRKRTHDDLRTGAVKQSLEDLRRNADGKGKQYQARRTVTTLDVSHAAEDRHGSQRAYFKEFVKVVEASDVIIHVLDARDPLACRSPEVEQFVRRVNPDKRVVLLLNKIDLAPKENVMDWLKYFREETPCVAFKCAVRGKVSSDRRDLLPKTGEPTGKDVLGADTLLQLLKNYARNRNMKTAITVGIVGFPNVGKSSLINSLKRNRNAAPTGNTPGLTKVSKEIILDKHVKLIDSPGVVFASTQGDSAGLNALRNCVKVERLADPVSAVNEIMRRCPHEQLMVLYKTGRFECVDDFLRQVGHLKGLLRKGGVPDVFAAARSVLGDWNNGRIPYYTSAPIRNHLEDKGHVSSAIVANYGEEFDAHKVFADEANDVLSGLPAYAVHDEYVITCGTAGSAKIATPSESDIQTSGMEVLPSREANREGSDNALDGMKALYQDASCYTSNEAEERSGHGSDAQRAQMLYGADGQFNPNVARAARKKSKEMKIIAMALKKDSLDDEDSGSDFEWEEH